MIQRIQTVYLLLASLLGAFLVFFNPHLWRARLINNTYRYFPDQSDYQYFYFILTMIITLLAFICIFLFKKRKLQFRLTLLNFFFSIGLVVLQYFLIEEMKDGLTMDQMLNSSTYLPAAFLSIPIIILLFLAARGIRKDEKLVRSLDRLR